MTKALEELWQQYLDCYAAATAKINNGTATIEDGIAVCRAHSAFAAAVSGPSVNIPPSRDEGQEAAVLLEVVRSAWATLLGVISIGSFQQINPDPSEHDATCTLILDAYAALSAAMKRAAE